MDNLYTKDDIEILVSTMHRDNLDFLQGMFPFRHFSDFNILVINQTSEKRVLNSEYPKVRIINSFDKGLSKSRNLALKNAIGNICVLADDDVEYLPDFQEKIVGAFNENKDTSLIAFRVGLRNGNLFRKYPEKRIVNPGIFERLNIISIEMVVNRLHFNETKFNENFGLAAKFGMREESLFINELLKKQKKIAMEPAVIVIHDSITTDSKATPEERYYIEGAFFTAHFNKYSYFKWLFLKLFFDLKQNKIKFKHIKSAFRSAEKGKKDFMEINENNN